jgi:hypothetical protein
MILGYQKQDYAEEGLIIIFHQVIIVRLEHLQQFKHATIAALHQLPNALLLILKTINVQSGSGISMELVHLESVI